MLSLLVLRAREPESLARFYELFGMQFALEQHGRGPKHMACETEAGVFEIYPCSPRHRSTRSVRLGFRVSNLDARCAQVAAIGGQVLRGPHASKAQRRATVQDPEGHLIDLLEI